MQSNTAAVENQDISPASRSVGNRKSDSFTRVEGTTLGTIGSWCRRALTSSTNVSSPPFWQCPKRRTSDDSALGIHR
jgi:hypothetical protein